MQNNNKKPEPRKRRFDFIYIGLIILTILGVFFLIRGMTQKKAVQYTYDEVVEKINNGTIKGELTVTPAGGENYELYVIKGNTSDGTFFANIFTTQVDEIEGLANVTIKVELLSSNVWLSVLLNIVPYVIFILIFIWLLRSSGNSKAFDFGKSTAQMARGKTVTFNDVAGCDEEKEELVEIIDFLKNPKKYNEIGARIPKGVLLFGPPGTGKTLIAKAVAGEAGVPFFSISGSDFVEMFVGVGASRVRDMFKTAKQNAPCIVFIDEIDAVGRQRGAGMGGGHDEREQTLNQLLVEMDGFNNNTGIIIMAATNRPDVLDPALLRPGRFDRQITISNPDVKGREAILKVHARNKHLEPGVKLGDIAQRTPGFSGADLENVLNEAALLTARGNRKVISMKDIDEAIDRVMMGPAKKSKKYTETERRLVAYHEAGHAVIGIKLENASEVQKITIVPRGQAGGYNLMMPKEETFFHTKSQMLETITGFLGGRVAEEIMFNEVSTGASNDFQNATQLARAMVTEYGMSDLGPVQYETPGGPVFLGRDYLKEKNFSDQVALEIDREQRKIIEECYQKAKEVISSNMDLLTNIAEYLLKVETLTKPDIEEICSTGKLKWCDEMEARRQEEAIAPVETKEAPAEETQAVEEKPVETKEENAEEVKEETEKKDEE